MMRFSSSKHNKNFPEKFHFESLMLPLAFVNGLFFGGYALRKIRQHWEGGPMD